MTMSMEYGDRAPQREPIFTTIDLSEGWDKESMRNILIERLKELGIYQPNLLFRGFDGNKIEIVKQYGADAKDSSAVFCSTEEELADERAQYQSALDFALTKKKAGLALYEGDKMELTYPYEYIAKKGTTLKEALLAVLILE